MNSLIVYMSKYGTTEECANNIKQNLKGNVEIINLKNESVNDLDSYNNIIILGGIYAGKVQNKLKDFTVEHENVLASKNVVVLICSKEGGDQVNQYIKNNFPEYIYKNAFIKDHLGHAINFKNMNFVEKSLLKSLFKIKESYKKIDIKKIKEVTNRLNEMDV